MRRPLLVFEDINTAPRRRLFRFLGVEVMATPYAWYSLPSFCVLGILVSFGQRPDSVAASTLMIGFEYGVLLYLSNLFHSLGHILAAEIVGAPMDILLLTGTRDVTLYRRPEIVPSKWMFVGRSLGGPLTNTVVGFVAFALWRQLLADWLLSFSVFNLAIAVWTLFPIPSMDGWVIWGELLGFRKHS
jgi:hypothetical protein